MHVKALIPVAAASVGLLVASPAASATARLPVHGADRMWIQSAQQGDIFEITAAKLALTRSTNAQVRALATRLLRDHSAALKVDRAVADQVGADIEVRMTAAQRWEVTEISSTHTSAADFDAKYVSLEANDHLDDQHAAKEELRLGSSLLVRKQATTSLAMYRMHEKLCKAVATALRKG